jgi:hypothetical protein
MRAEQLREGVTAHARDLVGAEAPGALRPPTARLLSEHTLLAHGEPGLQSWRPEEAQRNLREAVALIEAAESLRETGAAGWAMALRRAGDILEWLTTPPLLHADATLRLLAAAAFQLAGFPVIAGRYLTTADIPPTHFFQVFQALLSADFPGVLRALAAAWRVGALLPTAAVPADLALSSHTAETVAGAAGLLAADMRWGADHRLAAVSRRLKSLSAALLHSQGDLDWLIVRLTAGVAERYMATSARRCTFALREQLTSQGQAALEQYVRLGYEEGRSVLWPSQRRGIQALAEKQSFALCTPTGSGKTAIAELALLQSLFQARDNLDDTGPWVPLALYLVPSRALAAEAESKLARILSRVCDKKVVVTGLYGGADWGPTDYWISADAPTVLICTYEKAEALVRFLGSAFLKRLTLLVIDEAHQVQYEAWDGRGNVADSRALSLESLLARLFSRIRPTDCRVVALSAVAAGFEDVLASWVKGASSSRAEKTDYRSTRQFIGSLECYENGTFRMVYDLMDGASLEFPDTSAADSPYVRSPFPPHPPCRRDAGPEKALRPHLLWAAMHFAAKDIAGQRHPVLISITQNIEGVAADFLKLLSQAWTDAALPDYFEHPEHATPEGRLLWQRCLLACADYFGKTSYEYRLLQHGIVLHHGRMPGPLARLLVALVEQQLVFVVVATSTLSEGVNLPFETILIPTLRREQGSMTPQEFANLAGRAGRPGWSAEGRTLVLLGKFGERWRQDAAATTYKGLVARFRDHKLGKAVGSVAQSPLAALINSTFVTWQRLSSNTSYSSFLAWLESAASDDLDESVAPSLLALDGVLLSVVEDVDSSTNSGLASVDLEAHLTQVWRETYAYYAEKEEDRLRRAFVARARGVVHVGYPDRTERHRIYVTGLPVRSAKDMMRRYPHVQAQLKKSDPYALWSKTERFTYIEETIDTLQLIHGFSLPAKLRRSKVDWREILQWWLRHSESTARPSAEKTSLWYDYVSRYILFRTNWLLGSVSALALHEARGADRQIPQLEDWARTGMPWAVLWLKEMLTWGTVDPVAAYVLSRSGVDQTRAQAEQLAERYYSARLSMTADPNSVLDPRAIRDWVESLGASGEARGQRHVADMQVTLLRDFGSMAGQPLRCLPVEADGRIQWFDVAGFLVAESAKPEIWGESFADDFDFSLIAHEGKVVSSSYLV